MICRLRFVVLGLIAGATIGSACPQGLVAQSILGRVVDGVSGNPIAGVVVEIQGPNGFEFRSVTGSSGEFRVRVPRSGRYDLRAGAFGYLPADSLQSVEVRRYSEQVEVVIRLAAAPMELEGITIVARGLDLRHRGTFEGFRERRKHALKVGFSRVLSSEDPIMQTAFDVEDVLRWLPVDQEKCTVIYVDGKLAPGWADDVHLVVIQGIAGIEFYRRVLDAPLEFRGGGPPCLQSADFSVLALWRTPPGGG